MRIAFSITAALLTAALLVGCQAEPKSEAKRDALHQQAPLTIRELVETDPGLQDLIDKAYGYAIFPSIGKGAVGVGGAYGRGLVYEQGEFIGYAEVKQATIGLQLGGQTFAQLILFENKDALDRFRTGNFAFSANASAVAIESGASASAKYENGVAVFTRPNGGAMFEASIGGQKFSFVPPSDR